MTAKINRSDRRRKTVTKIWAHRGASSYAPENMLEPDAQTGILYSDVLCRIADYCKMAGADALHPAYYHRFIFGR